MATFNTTGLDNTTRWDDTTGSSDGAGERRLAAVAAALFLLGLSMVARSPPTHAGGVSGGDVESSEAGAHLVRRCRLGSKQELCYWAKVGSHHDAER